MKASVIIGTCGRDTLEDCLNSLEKQNFSEYEIIVVHNGDLNPKHDCRTVKSDKDNISVMRNKAVKEAEGDIVAFIDDDAVAEEEWLQKLMENYKDEDVDCVGGKIIPDFECEVPEKFQNLDKHILYGMLGLTFIDSEGSKEIKSPLLWACNLSFRKEVLEELGYFPERLGREKGNLLSDEERYLQIKALSEDYTIVFEPKAVVRHYIFEEELQEDYLVKRSIWQGISEIKRLEIEGELNKYIRSPDSINDLSTSKLFDKIFKLWGVENIKEKIDLAREIGRLIGLRRWKELTS